MRHRERTIVGGARTHCSASRPWAAVALAAMCGQLGCYEGITAPFPEPDYEYFTAHVYPVLVRDCGFTVCHADPDRFFTVFAPARLRLDPDEESESATEDEIAASYDHARAMLVSPNGDPRSAPLLRKPRQGAGHAGVDNHGNNVYVYDTDEGFRALLRWAEGATL